MTNKKVPLTVPRNKVWEYKRNYNLATKKTGRLLLFAGDQKIEHLNNDFYGAGIAPDDANPEHFFRIASQAKIGVFATQLGLIGRYGRKYRNVPYLVKLNSKTNLVNDNATFSQVLTKVEDVVRFKKQNRLNIVGVGITVYIGSEREAESLQQAAEAILKAHQQGLIAVVWMYPRGKNIKNENDIHLIAGGAGVAACLGADFVKVKYPYNKDKGTPDKFKEVVEAAGKTGILCVGGSKQNPKELLQHVHNQINITGTRGVAVGRNIHQLPLDKAVNMANALSAIINYGTSVKNAYDIYQGKKTIE